MTINGLNKEIKQLISKYSTKGSRILLEDELYVDHGIYGDDADEFFDEYSRIFDVDISNFDRVKYFPNEKDPVLDGLKILFFRNMKRKKYQSLKVKDLLIGIDKGFL